MPRGRLRLAVLAAVTGAFAFPLTAQVPASSAPSAQKTLHPHKHTAAKPSPSTLVVPEAAPAPPAPPPPDWPANDKPAGATVVWDSQGLRIDAANSSLQQILKEVSADTGAKVEGATTDQRIYGSYGPGPARDVLAQLLDGSGYNVLMIGDQGEGTPRQIVLSARPSGPAPVNAGGGRSVANDDDYEAEQPQQLEPPNFRNSFQPPVPQPPPGAPPRTPQQIMQEMQQRQEQMQEQNNQQK
jgi:hypothetical protein